MKKSKYVGFSFLMIGCLLFTSACAETVQMAEDIYNEVDTTVQDVIHAVLPTDNPNTPAGASTGINSASDAAINTGGDLPNANKMVAVTQTNFANGTYKINHGGHYSFSGDLNGTIAVDTAETVTLVLNGTTLISHDGPVILSTSENTINMMLVGGTVNYVTDNKIGNDDANAAIYVRGDLNINGSGALNVTANFKDGIRSKKILTINDGILDLTTIDHALKADDGIIMNGGDVTIAAQGKGFTSDNAVLIASGKINITESEEGIEGFTVTFTGGESNIMALDDGINARDPNAEKDTKGNPINTSSDVYVRFAGGTVRVTVAGDDVDAIDSNMNIFLEGGTLYASGPNNGPCSAIDLDGAFTISGGDMIAVGIVEKNPVSTTQPFVTVHASGQVGNFIEIKDAANKVMLSYIAPNGFTVVSFTSPKMIQGETYSVYVADKLVQTVTLTDLITGSTGGGRGPGRGGMQPPSRNPR